MDEHSNLQLRNVCGLIPPVYLFVYLFCWEDQIHNKTSPVLRSARDDDNITQESVFTGRPIVSRNK